MLLRKRKKEEKREKKASSPPFALRPRLTLFDLANPGHARLPQLRPAPLSPRFPGPFLTHQKKVGRRQASVFLTGLFLLVLLLLHGRTSTQIFPFPFPVGLLPFCTNRFLTRLDFDFDFDYIRETTIELTISSRRRCYT